MKSWRKGNNSGLRLRATLGSFVIASLSALLLVSTSTLEVSAVSLDNRNAPTGTAQRHVESSSTQKLLELEHTHGQNLTLSRQTGWSATASTATGSTLSGAFATGTTLSRSFSRFSDYVTDVLQEEKKHVEEDQLVSMVQDYLRTELEPHKDFTLLKEEDYGAWVFFTGVFLVLIVFDNGYLMREKKILSTKEALMYTLFWIGVAMTFNLYVLVVKGYWDWYNWLNGYVLEWMLSMDNLFVFAMVFDNLGCPDKLKHKPLFWGIMGWVVFRMVFFVVGEALMHTLHFMHLVFGTFLIYTGVKTVTWDDEDDDPTQHPLVMWWSWRIPMINGYDDQGNFFVRVKIDSEGKLVLPGENKLFTPNKTKTENPAPVYAAKDWYATPRESDVGVAAEPSSDGSDSSRNSNYEWRCTMLFIVVLCLELTDLMFAVDSVSAIVAQIPDLFLAYTACIFAMLGLRATFFLIDDLIRMFSLLKYGIAFILVFIGVKLIISKTVHIEPSYVCAVLVGTLFICMLASIYVDSKNKEREQSKKLSAKALFPEAADVESGAGVGSKSGGGKWAATGPTITSIPKGAGKNKAGK